MGVQRMMGFGRKKHVDPIDSSMEVHDFERGGTFDLDVKTAMEDRICVNVVTGVVAVIIYETAIPLTVVNCSEIGMQNYTDPLVPGAERVELTAEQRNMIQAIAYRQLQMTSDDKPSELWLRQQITTCRDVELGTSQRWLASVVDTKTGETGYLGVDHPSSRVVVQFLGRAKALDVGPANPSPAFVQAESSRHPLMSNAEVESMIVRDRFGIRDFDRVELEHVLAVANAQDPTKLEPLPFDFPESTTPWAAVDPRTLWM